MALERIRKRSRKRHPVFLDVRQRRALWLKIGGSLAGFALLAWLTTVATGIYLLEILPGSAKLDQLRQRPEVQEPAEDYDAEFASCPGGMAGTSDAARAATVAYLRTAEDLAFATFRRDCTAFGGVLVEALAIDAAAQTVGWLDRPSLDGALHEIAGAGLAPAVELVAMLPLPTLSGDERSVLDDPGARGRLVAGLRDRAAEMDASGVCLYAYVFDFGHLQGLRQLLRDLRAGLPADRSTCLVANAEGPLWRDTGVISAVDSVVLRAFREPAADAPPGPLSPQGWFEDLIDDGIAAMGPDKLRVALGSFGYLWIEDAPAPVQLSFVEAMHLAAKTGATIAVDAASLNTRITFADAEGRAGEIWLLDAVSLHNQAVSLGRKGVTGRLLWSMGLEDPAAWPVLAAGGGLIPAGRLETVAYPDVIRYVGQGPFRTVIERAQAGQRSFQRDARTRLIRSVGYATLPRPFTVERYGALAAKVVALTFDDGPDDPYTVQILDVLKDEKVAATFFVIGANVVQYPDLVRRIFDEGHEIGSHTFFHPESTGLSAERLRLELNALQRLLASVTGRTTYLFRAPYGRSEGPMARTEAEQQIIVEEAGLVVAGGDIVPRDWEQMTAEDIVDYVMENRTGPDAQVIVMHDAGGDRSATAAAVPLLIKRLRDEGYKFVPLSSFLALSRDDVMPVARDMLTPLDQAYYATLSAVGHALIWIFWVGIGLGVARTLLVLSLALLRRRHQVSAGARPLRVAVVIPAYNEEPVIADGIRAALASDYPDLSVIVVDDGSTDATALVVQREFGGDARVRLLRQANGGKWSALNLAYANLAAEVVVAVDADTILDPGAVRLLAGHFADPAVGAVAGVVKVGNRHSLLPRLQALEYITAQSIDRRAAECLNAMLVVPGSIGAWRVEAVRKVGLYSAETLTEDADLTIAVIRAGYRVVFDERAISTTDGTETVRAFMKQRLRWTFGMMQATWKHRRAAKTAKGVGLFTIPDLWLTGIGLGLIAPIVDAMVVGAVVTAVIAAAQGQPLQATDASLWILAGWVALPLLDLAVILAAFAFDRREHWSLILLAPLQRLVYRPLLYVTVYRAVWTALAGRIAGWGKLIRLRRVGRPVN